MRSQDRALHRSASRGTEASGWLVPKITKLCLHLLKLCRKTVASFFPNTVRDKTSNAHYSEALTRRVNILNDHVDSGNLAYGHFNIAGKFFQLPNLAAISGYRGNKVP